MPGAAIASGHLGGLPGVVHGPIRGYPLAFPKDGNLLTLIISPPAQCLFTINKPSVACEGGYSGPRFGRKVLNDDVYERSFPRAEPSAQLLA